MLRPFALHRPDTAEAASRLLAELGSAALYCGGTELLQVMKMGLAHFEHLIDLKGIAELRGIAAAEGGLRIGAATTHREIERSALVASRYPSFNAMARHVANVRVRNVGSIGGNLCFAEPHSDPATYLIACDARLELASDAGRRTLGVGDFVTDAFTTARGRTEVLVAVHLPATAPGTAIAYRKLAFVERPTVSVACRIAVRDGVVRDARVVVGSVGAVPAVVNDAGQAIVGGSIEDAARLVSERVDAIDDQHASAEYKRHLVAVLVRRAAHAATAEALRA